MILSTRYPKVHAQFCTQPACHSRLMNPEIHALNLRNAGDLLYVPALNLHNYYQEISIVLQSLSLKQEI
jgi:hypothetical protein